MRALLAFATLALAACTAESGDSAQVDTSTYGAGDNWDNPGGDWAGSHFSRLTDISADNVGQLGLAWQYDLGTTRVQEATPVVIDGVMYTSGNLGRVYALDAATGKELWTFTPDVDGQVNRYACCDQANRGVAVHDGKVYVAALDGVLYALDAKTGAADWHVDTVVDHTRAYTSTGAPRIAGNLVIIGNGGAEDDTRGYITAYDTANGKQAWRFWTVPHDPKDGPQESEALDKALKTWSPDSAWDIGGGGTAWDAITYDPQFDQVIVGVGNGTPYPIAARSPGGGDNLYLECLVALDAKTGKLKWYFQETPEGPGGLRRGPADGADQPQGGRQGAAGAAPFAQERLHVRGRSPDRQTACRQCSGAHELGRRVGPREGPEPDARRLRLHEWPEDRLSRDARRTQLVPGGLRSDAPELLRPRARHGQPDVLDGAARRDQARSEVHQRRRGDHLLARPAGGRARPAAACSRGDGKDRAVAVGQGQALFERAARDRPADRQDQVVGSGRRLAGPLRHARHCHGSGIPRRRRRAGCSPAMPILAKPCGRSIPALPSWPHR